MKITTEGVRVDEKRLEKYGENTARQTASRGTCTAGRALRRLRRDVHAVTRTWRRVSRFYARRLDIPPAARWLLDNGWLAQQVGSEVARELTRAGRVPAHGGAPAALKLAEAFLRLETEGEAPAALETFLRGYQSARSLTQRELEMLPLYLRAAVIAVLREGCALLEAYLRGERESADIPELIEGFQLLHRLEELDFGPLLLRANAVEALLRTDPAGVYPRMDEDSRAACRRRVSDLAKKFRLPETEVVRRCLKLAAASAGNARHVGHYIFKKPLGEDGRRRTGRGYPLAVLFTAAALAAGLGVLSGRVWPALLLYLPLTQAAKQLLDAVLLRLKRPWEMLRLEDLTGLEDEAGTLCVVTALLTGEKQAADLAGLLERYYLANRDCGDLLRLGVLADLPESEKEREPGHAAILEAAAREIDRLNGRYGGRFYLLCRERRLRDGVYMGWERKRGALLELSRLLLGRACGLDVLRGDPAGLKNIRFVITLDSDTRLNAGSAKELIGAMLHPLNRAVVDGERRVVVDGHAVLQPRISPELDAANRSRFAMLYAGQGGVDPYGGACGDVYQDLYGRGSYCGKGIFDVAAFSRCLDGRFPENRVLSHDLLEGSYLRAGYASRTELSDGFPHRAEAWFRRQDRWTRGDWQLLPWLFPRVRDEKGEREKNPLSVLDRWKILDNLFRSLRDPLAVIALAAGLLSGGRAALFALLAALLCTGTGVLLGAVSALLRPSGRYRYHSTVCAGFGGSLLLWGVQFLLLPWSAWVHLRAVCTALWRMAVSRKNLLQWVPAAGSGGEGSTPGRTWLRMLPAVLFAAAVMLLAVSPWGRLVGFAWFFAPAAVLALDRPARDGRRPLSGEDRAFLLSQAEEMLRYFTDWCREEDHYLPPDNLQCVPESGAVHRTSPTNIGLAMLSLLAGVDLDLLDRTAALTLLGHMTDTLEALPKWRGHLYNWYDTRTLAPLTPACVSTVDSGNLAGCLISLENGLREWDDGAAERLAARLRALERGMDFAPLYDPVRRLLRLGWDCENDRPMPGHYDMLESEARLASYIACARGSVSRRHWRRLSRALAEKDGYRGMVSWTGTAFEYWMPRLLLPSKKNSLLYESDCFCLYAQRRRGDAAGVPWGISESGYAALDGEMRYRYKAHGVQAIGLKRGLDEELVVAPYASFLALAVDPASAAGNLRRLRSLGLSGAYGLWEAADFTPSRAGKSGMSAVMSHMAHHVGMSLAAVDNALNGDVLVRRFLRDPEMAAMTELLEEKVPLDAPVIRRHAALLPPMALREGRGELRRAPEEICLTDPRCAILANPAYTLLTTDAGFAEASCRGKLVYRSGGPLDPGGGMRFYLKEEGAVTALLPAGPEVQVACAVEQGMTEHTCRLPGLSLVVRTAVSDDESAEVRELTLENGEEPRQTELACLFEPVLEERAAYDAHPAFSKLALESFEEDGVLLFRRRARDGGKMTFLAVAADTPFAFDTSREKALGRGGTESISLALLRPPGWTLGSVLDPCALLRWYVPLAAGERRRVRFSLCVAETGARAARGAKSALKGRRDGRMGRWVAAASDLGAPEFAGALEMLSHLRFPTAGSDAPEGPEFLWRHGVSGDYPVAAIPFDPKEEAALLRTLKAYNYVRRCGFEADLLILTDDGGDYLRRGHTAALEQVRLLGCEDLLGRRTGIHLIDAPAPERERLLALAAWRPDLPARPRLPAEPRRPVPVRERGMEGEFLPDGSFTFLCDGALPPAAWSHVLANRTFGYVAADAGMGHMWYKNARENQLTPWGNDPLAVTGGEELTLDGRSLFAGTGTCRVTYGPGWAKWEREGVALTAFVPPDFPARVFLLHVDAPGILRWRLRPVLGAGERDAAACRGVLRDGVAVFGNRRSRAFPGQRAIFCASRDLTQAACGETFDAEIPAAGDLVLVAGCAMTGEERDGILALRDVETARAALEHTRDFWHQKTGALTLETPEKKFDRYLNCWALYQTEACRLLGRSSLYQCGGAYGFRDQLQDVCALLPFDPDIARTHILRCAGRQYDAGDVLHWWHEDADGSPRGVRTKCSDDLLWLPWAICRLVETWNDASILNQPAPYLTSEPLGDREQERYETPEKAEEWGDVFDHCVRALELVLRRGRGDHGLLHMLRNDWNDGMSRVGLLGRGESVWLSWFAADVLRRFAPLCRRRGEDAMADRYEAASAELIAACEGCWDGEWYLRAFYDDGEAIGGRGSEQCMLDSVAQSFAAFAGADRRRVRTALRSSVDALFDREAGLVKLLTPPFDFGDRDPGYIAGYVPGVRENGGQYTHAAIWLAMACLENGLEQDGFELLRAIAPGGRDPERYRLEPYVIAADVYANPQHRGRGGWSWYTGAAGWYHQAVTRSLLGLKVRGGILTVEPRLPRDWPGYTAHWKTDRAEITIRVRRGRGQNTHPGGLDLTAAAGKIEMEVYG